MTVEAAEPSRDLKIALLALQRQAHIYGGTVPYAEIQKRRERNRVARVSRRKNRQR